MFKTGLTNLLKAKTKSKSKKKRMKHKITKKQKKSFRTKKSDIRGVVNNKTIPRSRVSGAFGYIKKKRRSRAQMRTEEKWLKTPAGKKSELETLQSHSMEIDY